MGLSQPTLASEEYLIRDMCLPDLSQISIMLQYTTLYWPKSKAIFSLIKPFTSLLCKRELDPMTEKILSKPWL